jgi:hypothetical protein
MSALPPNSGKARTSSRPRPSGAVRAAMVVLPFTAIGAELAIAVALLEARAEPGDLLLAHLSTCVLLVAGTLAIYRQGGRDPAFLLVAVSTASLGPMGAAGAGLGAALRWVFARRATPFEAWYAQLFPGLESCPTRELYERIVLRGAGPDARSTVAPFADVMALGSVQQKQAVITLIADEFRPAFAAALRNALNDAEPAIRVQAATASARIENRFLERGMALEERHAAAPEAPDILLELARYHDEYANTGLLDAGRAEAERRQALSFFERLARLRPGDPEVVHAMGRLLLRLGQPEQALEHLELLAKGARTPPEVLALYLECLYELRRTDQLRRAAQRLAGRSAAAGLPWEIREAVRLWAYGAAEDVPADEATP